MRWICLVCLLPFFALSADDPKPAEPKLYMTTRGKLLFEDDLSKLPTKAWKASKGKYEIVEGVLKVSEKKEDDHGAVARKTLTFKDAIVRVEFKLDGAKQTTVSFNDSQGHVCRVLVKPDSLTVQKDDIDGKAGADKAVVFQTVKTKLEPGWHTLQVEVCGKELLASLDDKTVAFGEHDYLNRPKVNVGLTVSGESVSFRNFKVWEATPSKEWEKVKATLKK
jgi:hypothetical protein